MENKALYWSQKNEKNLWITLTSVLSGLATGYQYFQELKFQEFLTHLYSNSGGLLQSVFSLTVPEVGEEGGMYVLEHLGRTERTVLDPCQSEWCSVVTDFCVQCLHVDVTKGTPVEWIPLPDPRKGRVCRPLSICKLFHQKCLEGERVSVWGTGWWHVDLNASADMENEFR